MRNGTPIERSHRLARPDHVSPSMASRMPHAGSRFEPTVLSIGVPTILLHGVGGGGGFVDEIITFGLLGGLVIGLVLLSFRGARKKNKPRKRRGRRRSRR